MGLPVSCVLYQWPGPARDQWCARRSSLTDRISTAEGRSRAKARGTHMGRPPSLKNTGTAEGGHQTARAGRYVAGIGRQLRPQHRHHAPRHARRLDCVSASIKIKHTDAEYSQSIRRPRNGRIDSPARCFPCIERRAFQSDFAGLLFVARQPERS